MVRDLVIACAACALLGGCLEGDPNPLVNGGDAAVGGGSGGDGGTPGEVSPSSQCSKASSVPVTVTFRNTSPNLTVNLFWVDFSCNESRYATLAPGAQQIQPTFVSHLWRIRDAGTNALYKEFAPIAAGQVTVEVP